MKDNNILEDIFIWIKFAISTYFYISPVVTFIKVVKAEMRYNDSRGILLICNITLYRQLMVY